MTRRLAAIILALPLIASAGLAQAASCSTKQLQGTWVGHATDQADLYCLMKFKQNGETKQSSCFNPKTLIPTGSLDGSLTVDTNCKVTGSFDLTIYKSGKVSPATFSGKLNLDKGLMNGDFVIFGAGEDYRFVQQFD